MANTRNQRKRTVVINFSYCLFFSSSTPIMHGSYREMQEISEVFMLTNLSQLIEELGNCSRVLLGDLDWLLILEQSLIIQQVQSSVAVGPGHNIVT